MASQLTRLEIVTKAADMVGRSLIGTTRSGATHNSILDEMYEWAQLRIARAYSFPELDVRDTTTADTVSATMSYSFSTLFGASARVKDILSVVLEDGTSSVRLKRWLQRDFYRRFPYPEGETNRKSTIYTRVGDNLHLFPVPDGAYDIHTIYSKWPTRATGDSSNSDYNDKDDLLIAGTIAEYFRHLQEKNEATYWDSVFVMKLKDSLKSVVHPKDWEPEGRAFNSSVLTHGDFWTDPLIMRNL